MNALQKEIIDYAVAKGFRKVPASSFWQLESSDCSRLAEIKIVGNIVEVTAHIDDSQAWQVAMVNPPSAVWISAIVVAVAQCNQAMEENQ